VENNLQDKALWRDSDYAAHYFAREVPYLKTGLRQAIGPSVLQIGSSVEQMVIDELDLPYLVRTEIAEGEGIALRADPAFLPFAPDSFATVILPHVLEGHPLPHQVLREAHRVLMSDGHIVVTGFNPLSITGLQRIIRPSAVKKGKYYTPRRVIDWLQLLGFEVVASAMFQYGPLSRSSGVLRMFRFIESIGDRWLPMLGGGYMITARKRDAGRTMVGRLRFARAKPKLAAPASSAQSPTEHFRSNPDSE